LKAKLIWDLKASGAIWLGLPPGRVLRSATCDGQRRGSDEAWRRLGSAGDCAARQPLRSRGAMFTPPSKSPNILNDYVGRARTLPATGRTELEPDVVALQEVACPRTMQRLADQLVAAGYLCPKIGNQHDIEGIAFSRLPIE
jgi:hypothetical protein